MEEGNAAQRNPLVTPRRTIRRRAVRSARSTMEKLRQISSNSVINIKIRNPNPVLEASLLDATNLETKNAKPIDNVVVDTIECNIPMQLSKSDQIRQWSLKHNITRGALGELLGKLNEWIPDENFRKDPRTLLKTPRCVNIQEICGGSFYHFGVKRWIIDCVSLGLKEYSPTFKSLSGIKNLISLKIGIDGLPISKSSKVQFWPILLSIDQAKVKKVYIVSIFCGEQKPNSVEDFLRPFVNDMKDLENNGLVINGVLYTIRIRCVLADAPARSFIKCVKGHNAYFGCERCYSKGSWSKRLHFSLHSGSILYDDEGFSDKRYTEHHIADSPLSELKLGMISQIPLDYMHLVCLGVVKKLIKSWVEGPIPFKLSSREKNTISDRLVNFRPLIPSDFSRKCRNLNEVCHWKATEFRLFLLYIGPSALVDALDSRRYNHFMLLHAAMYIFSSSAASKIEWINFAKYLIETFVNQIPSLYHKDFLTYNMHSLQHLQVLNHGKVDNMTCFEFENYMQILKRMLQSKSKPLEQVVKRQEESDWYQTIGCKTDKMVFDSGRNSCFITESGNFVITKNVYCNRSVCEVSIFKCLENVPTYPGTSSKLAIYLVSELSEEVFQLQVEKLSQKCIVLPFRSKQICIPLCH